ncbi:uncharacterized protein LOC126744461 isoform X2 [Anthonomus grandis grandis]|nr:uncharacterized protein LOC126744461 isoform X2 [Anthonomus grandis grandis]
MRVNMRVGKRPDLDDDVINKRDFLSPNRRLRLVVRPGKRIFPNPEYPRYHSTQTDLSHYRSEPKRKLRLVMRTGKRTSNDQDTAVTPQYDTLTSIEDTPLFQHNNMDSTGLKRSAPQFLLNPRIGKNDRTWKVLQKRNDPKASDLWFGPRIGRSNEKSYEDSPWSYIILRGNRQESDPSSEMDEQSTDESSEQ